MASWESRSWPARRWLADRLIGKRSYSRNLATVPQDWVEVTHSNSMTSGYGTYWDPRTNTPKVAFIGQPRSYLPLNVFDQENNA